jgi:hypothetical protein
MKRVCEITPALDKYSRVFPSIRNRNIDIPGILASYAWSGVANIAV